MLIVFTSWTGTSCYIIHSALCGSFTYIESKLYDNQVWQLFFGKIYIAELYSLCIPTAMFKKRMWSTDQSATRFINGGQAGSWALWKPDSWLVNTLHLLFEQCYNYYKNLEKHVQIWSTLVNIIITSLFKLINLFSIWLLLTHGVLYCILIGRRTFVKHPLQTT